MAKSTKAKKTKSSSAKTSSAKKTAAKKAAKKTTTVLAKTKSPKKVSAKKAEVKVKSTRSKAKKAQKTNVTEVKTTVMTRKPAYSKKELEYFKQIILEKRKEILEQLESLRERMLDESGEGFVNENSPYSLHMAEQGTDAFEKEKNYLWAQRETKFLSYLDAALKRIEDGTYGYCIDCGKVIEKGRLEAVPHTQHCVNCKVKFSK
ncbi:MAG: TraR/DksA C4-type zinc finger protein [Ignavibacteria bacterium]|nr:TraR/DksA C4-type zinc finger protein [Ignavibacteria bacterium]MDH7528498.1 TraR/DksA C4-type zinc finger protein [Ignavibacteria bacterium]